MPPPDPLGILAANVAGLRVEVDLLKMIVAAQGEMIAHLIASQRLLGEGDSRQVELAKLLGGLQQDFHNGNKAKMSRLRKELSDMDSGEPDPPSPRD